MRTAKPILCAVAGASLLAGCCTKAPPTRAEIHQQSPMLAAVTPTTPWKAVENPASGTTLENWLNTFADPHLEALVGEAIANNLDLRVASARVERSAQYVEMAKAALRPAVRILGTGGFNSSGDDVSSALQGLSLGASWEPDLWARLRYGRNASQASYEADRADFEFSRQSLAASVAKTWFLASEIWQQLQITESMMQSGQELVALAEKRRDVGAGNEQEIALARANLGPLQDTAKQVRLAHQQTVRALELLLGRYPAAELNTRPDLPALPGPVPAGLPLEMLERRPDMIGAERRVAAAFNRVGEAKAARLPRITLNASLSVIESEILQLKSDYENPSAGVGARLIAPLYEGGALNAQVAIRTAEQKEAVAQYARLAARALGDVENALASEKNLAEREEVVARTLADNRRALELMQTSFRVGRVDLRSVQQQQLSVYAAQVVLLRLKGEQLNQRVNLHLALGGSFATMSAPPPAKPASSATVVSTATVMNQNYKAPVPSR